MLTKVDVLTSSGEILELPIGDASSGYSVQPIEGLDPVNATLVFSSFAGQDGSEFQNARRENRNIVMKLGLEPNWAIQDVAQLRQKLYKYFMPKSYVKLKFTDDTIGVVYAIGRVETMVSPRFTEDPLATISILCGNPDFDAMVNLSFGGMSTAGTSTVDRTYDGTVESGFLFTMNVDRTISGFTLYNTLPDNSVKSLTISVPMVSGDVLKISTVPGDKYARLTHLGVESSVLYGVLPASTWLSLVPGLNKFRVLLSGTGIPWTIEYTDKFGGL